MQTITIWKPEDYSMLKALPTKNPVGLETGAMRMTFTIMATTEVVMGIPEETAIEIEIGIATDPGRQEIVMMTEILLPEVVQPVPANTILPVPETTRTRTWISSTMKHAIAKENINTIAP